MPGLGSKIMRQTMCAITTHRGSGAPNSSDHVSVGWGQAICAVFDGRLAQSGQPCWLRVYQYLEVCTGGVACRGRIHKKRRTCSSCKSSPLSRRNMLSNKPLSTNPTVICKYFASTVDRAHSILQSLWTQLQSVSVHAPQML